MEKRTCGKCGRIYAGYPAISRLDNKTEICPECGTREALEAAGITGAKADEIIKTIQSREAR